MGIGPDCGYWGDWAKEVPNVHTLIAKPLNASLAKSPRLGTPRKPVTLNVKKMPPNRKKIKDGGTKGPARQSMANLVGGWCGLDELAARAALSRSDYSQ